MNRNVHQSKQELVTELRKKLAVVESDLQQSQNDGSQDKKRMTLVDYISYMKDEIRMLEESIRNENTR